jgi:hypothetical protein
VRQLLGQISGFSQFILLSELIGEIDSVVETYPFALMNRGDRQGCRWMGFAVPILSAKIKLQA